MVYKSKKIFSLTIAVLIVFAGSVLCTLGVRADSGSDNSSYDYLLNLGSQTSSSLPLSWNYVSGTRQSSGRMYIDRDPVFSVGTYHLTFNFSASFSVYPDTTPLDLSQIDVQISGIYGANNLTSTFNIPTNVAETSNIVTVANPNSNPIRFTVDLDFQVIQPLNYNYLLLSCSINTYHGYILNFSFDSYYDDFIEPPIVVPDSTQFEKAEIGSYFMNYKASNGTWIHGNNVSDSLPFVYKVSSVNMPFDYYCGALIDNWTDILKSYTVVQGEVRVLIADPLGYITSDDSKFNSAQICFVNQSDPHSNGFQYQNIPTTWEKEINLTRVRSNTWGYIFYINFYFVIPNTWQTDLSVTPLTLGFFFYTLNNQYIDTFATSFYHYELNYYNRSSNSSPLPDNPNGGYPAEVTTPTVEDTTQREFSWLDTTFSSESETKVAQIDDYVSNIFSLFDFTGYTSVLTSIWNVINYDGTSFEFKFPAATIPFPDNQHLLTLWNEQTIPFQHFIDNIPQVYKVIIAYLVLLFSLSVFIGSFFYFFYVLRSGDVRVK